MLAFTRTRADMSRDDLADFLLQKVRISVSQEELLNSIPGWEEIGGIIDDTPSQQSPSQSSQQRIFDVTGSSVSDDQDVSQKAVEWASPEQTPIAPSRATTGIQSYEEAFDSDRSQSPKRRLSWGLGSRRDDVSSSKCDKPDSSVNVVSDGATDALRGNKNAAAVTSTAALPVIGKPHGAENNLADESGKENQKKEPWGQPLPQTPESEDEHSRSPPMHSEAAQEDRNVKKISTAGETVGDSPMHHKSSGKVRSPNDERVCVRTMDDSAKPNEKGNGCKPQVDSRDVAVVSSGKDLKEASSDSSLDSEGEKRVKAPMPSKAVQEKLRNLRRLGAENGSRKRGRGEEETLQVPDSVMDVVKQCSDGKPAPMVGAAELLSAAVRAGITLPPPFSRNYFRSL